MATQQSARAVIPGRDVGSLAGTRYHLQHTKRDHPNEKRSRENLVAVAQNSNSWVEGQLTTGTDQEENGRAAHALARSLAQRIAAGDRDAEVELVDQYGERLGFLLRRWTRDEDAAQELFQETFSQALQKLRSGELRQPERLPAYLVGLAKNLATYHYRKGDRRAAYHLTPGEKKEFADPKPGLLTRLLKHEKAVLVRQVLAELPTDRDREVLSRFYLAEDDSQAICSELGLAKTHFKRVLFRARQRYRALFEARAQRPEAA